MLTVFTSLACYPGASPYCHRYTAGCWAGIGGACRFPRTTWRPLTLFGQPGSPSFATDWRYCHADWTVPRQDVNSSFPPCMCHPSAKRCLHTRRFGTLASPPPPVSALPWGPHLPGQLIGRENNAINCINCIWFGTEVYGHFPFSFAF